MTTRLGRLAFGPSKSEREQHGIAREKQSPIKTATFFAQIDRLLIVRCLSVFEEVKTKSAHPPLFQLVSIGWKTGVLVHSLRRLFVLGSHVGCIERGY
jgi:hypothetical protein